MLDMNFEIDDQRNNKCSGEENTLVLQITDNGFALRDKKSSYYLVLGTDLNTDYAEINIDTLNEYKTGVKLIPSGTAYANVKTWKIERQCC